MSKSELPIDLSVVIPTHNRVQILEQTLRCLARAGEEYGHPFEVLVVDDGSSDSTPDLFSAKRCDRAPLEQLRYLRQENSGPAAARNRGVREAKGQLILFLGDDILVTPVLLKKHLEAHQARGSRRPVAVLGQTAWSPEMRLGPLLRFLEEGDQFGFRNIGDRENVPYNYFYTSNVSLSRQALLEEGLFDEGFPHAAWEDVELAYRLTRRGMRIVYEPEALAYHFHPTTWASFCRRREVVGQDAVILHRKHPETKQILNLQWLSPGVATWKVRAADAFGHIYSLLERYGLDRGPVAFWRPVFSRLSFHHYFRGVRRGLELQHESGESTARQNMRNRVLLVTHEALGRNLAGPAIRAVELGRALSREFHVVLATPQVSPHGTTFPFQVATYSAGDQESLRKLTRHADVILIQGFTLQRFPFLGDAGKPLAVDLYCPFSLENLEYRESIASEESFHYEQYARDLSALNDQLRVGDFFICATEKQRDFWLGMLHALNRITPANYRHDPSLRKLLAVVPFGVPAEPPRKQKSVLRGVVPGIEPDDKVLLWGGTLLNWLDPLTLIRAVGVLSTDRDDIRLFFLGIRHPNPEIPPMTVVEASRELADRLELLGRSVFFNEWVPYEERADYLLESDLGVCTHRAHLESRLAFRTRLLDCIWARLPMVVTEGDAFAGLIRAKDLGLVVPPGDPRAVARAIATALDDAEAQVRWKANLGALRAELTWDRVVRPLAEFCHRPEHAPDRVAAVRSARTDPSRISGNIDKSIRPRTSLDGARFLATVIQTGRYLARCFTGPPERRARRNVTGDQKRGPSRESEP